MKSNWIDGDSVTETGIVGRGVVGEGNDFDFEQDDLNARRRPSRET